MQSVAVEVATWIAQRRPRWRVRRDVGDSARDGEGAYGVKADEAIGSGGRAESGEPAESRQQDTCAFSHSAAARSVPDDAHPVSSGRVRSNLRAVGAVVSTPRAKISIWPGRRSDEDCGERVIAAEEARSRPPRRAASTAHRAEGSSAADIRGAWRGTVRLPAELASLATKPFIR